MRLLALFLLTTIYLSCHPTSKKILVFTKTAGFRHTSIEDGVQALFKIGKTTGFAVDTTSDAKKFTDQNLKQYSALVFLSTTGDLFDSHQENALERYIQSGGGFVGIHAATDAEYQWPWYNKLVGGYFASHPHIQNATLDVVDPTHSSTKHLDKQWIRNDEWYNFKSLHEQTKKLITIDESSYQGGANGKNHPMSWYHEYDGGRSWYTALGHTKESFSEEKFLKHIEGGILYAIGDNKRNLAKAKTPLMPEDDRFTIKKLVEGQLFEPTEMTILPNLDVLIAQRRGEIMRYYHDTGKVKQIAKLNVYHQATVPNVNAEEGLLGIQKDPNYAKNNFVFLYYAVKDSAVNRLSRFIIDKDSLHTKSEKIILDVVSTRNICCHTGGSIAFSGDGQFLFLSTGDNATPFDEDGQKYVNEGYGPQDNRAGHEQYDARRSSANTNDLRGKILKIKINADGSYSIPAGNLFAKGQEKTRPEIYAMGLRNPYRISIDQKNNNLYWGEVGPDAADDNANRGPKGYDEINVAPKSGFFGWPLFIGNNYPYKRYDYTSGKSGELYDAAKPLNESKNNTGLVELPPTTPAMIYYPYDKSKDFPDLASGGRNAMVGPVYYTDMYPKETRYPDYYNGKLLIYDWIRNWVKWVNVGRDNNIEPFLQDYSFSNIIDVEVAPNGELYLLEYGKGWFSKNFDAGLSKVVYNANNRVPKLIDFAIDKQAGKLPFTFTATAKASDPDQDNLKYIWKIGTQSFETKLPTFTHTISQNQQAPISVMIADPSGNTVVSKQIMLNAGNAMPIIDIAVEGNQSMYFPNAPKKYNITLKDEDGSIVQDNLMIQQQMSIAGDQYALGHQSGGAGSIGENLIASSDCQSCHKKDTTSIGPSYVSVAKRYKGDFSAKNFLAEKIRIGGSGNWGEGAMAAHPTLSETEALQIADWILSLANEKTQKQVSLPITGSLSPKIKKNEEWNNAIYLKASYTDLPTSVKTRQNTAAKAVELKPNFILSQHLSNETGFDKAKIDKKEYRLLPKWSGFVELKSYDLYQVKSIKLMLIGQYSEPYKLTLKDKKTKKDIATGIVDNPKYGIIHIPVQNGSMIRDLILECSGPGGQVKDLLLDKIVFEPL